MAMLKEIVDSSFPLTPALSLGERENFGTQNAATKFGLNPASDV